MAKSTTIPPQVRAVCKYLIEQGFVQDSILPARYTMRETVFPTGESTGLFTVGLTLDGGGCWRALVKTEWGAERNEHTVLGVEARGKYSTGLVAAL